MKKTLLYSIFFSAIALSNFGCVERTEVQFPFTPEAACQEVVILDSQAEVDQFNQAEIKGDLILSGNDITDLSGLSELASICGDFEINFCHGLTSLAGLNTNLSVGGHFFVIGNTNLIDFRSFPTNFHVDGRMKVQSNSRLTSLTGISSELFLQKLELIDNSNLQNLAGIPDHVDEFYLDNCPSLKSLTGLTPGFETIEFRIIQCESLQNLQGFPIGLQSLMVLELKNNESLEDLSGLTNLRLVRRELTIEDNPNLSICCTLRQFIDSFGIIPFKTSIRNNHPDCTPAAIIENAPC